MEFSVAIFLFQMACSHGVFGNTCDEDVWCINWTKMYECHERYFGDIHTPKYLQAIKDGHNIKPRTKHPH
jgi:hypothetical protein